MMEKYKTVYVFDTQTPSHKYIGQRLVEGDYQLQPNETLDEPQKGQDNFWNAETGAWVTSTVTVYCYDVNNNNSLSDMFSVPAGTTLKAGQTTVVPKDGLYEPQFNGTAWESGITEAEWNAQQPKVEVKPTAQQKANAEMSVQIAQMKQEQVQQAKLNAQLTLDIAALKKQMKAEAPSTQEG
ncbi:hypothetical protein [Limosilactobacillus antri]|uniref:Uncharacterized protein n=1 Tax=Limosilactobacillus antri DSM 16041 TaxID=525309 RepID=C8P8W6_9LACO|nr:hypothetical protein [Limosilactobacillus antri]EEW53037.1 hypothetical protein HMPREF0494_1760 [Limosilactobacillus antri DSM 16041]KRK60449.1 hypothetical protein FC31_GL001519 [Limosilactobacillus antri DSM 16041]